MKIYQLMFGHRSYDEGYVAGAHRIYTTREEAEKAEKFAKSIPANPCTLCDVDVFISEVEVEETFTPWLSPEKIAAMQAEVDEYYAQLEKENEDYWVPEDEYPED